MVFLAPKKRRRAGYARSLSAMLFLTTTFLFGTSAEAESSIIYLQCLEDILLEGSNSGKIGERDIWDYATSLTLYPLSGTAFTETQDPKTGQTTNKDAFVKVEWTDRYLLVKTPYDDYGYAPQFISLSLEDLTIVRSGFTPALWSLCDDGTINPDQRVICSPRPYASYGICRHRLENE